VDATQADTASARNDDFMLLFEASDRPSPNQSPLRLTAAEPLRLRRDRRIFLRSRAAVVVVRASLPQHVATTKPSTIEQARTSLGPGLAGQSNNLQATVVRRVSVPPSTTTARSSTIGYRKTSLGPRVKSRVPRRSRLPWTFATQPLVRLIRQTVLENL
jgi:hypothetical protein